MEKNIIRVFPRRTSYTPFDDLVFIGSPPQTLPKHQEIHISCTFTWDKAYCRLLQDKWQEKVGKAVLLGGVAFDSSCEIFTPGLYVKSGVTFTSRGCYNSCPWCLVPEREGRLKHLPIVAGNLIQDNNFLQTDRSHQAKVFEMLKTQKGISFRGGLQADLINDWFIERIRGLKIRELWLACDTNSHIAKLEKAAYKLLKGGFKPYQLRCYALIGINGMESDLERLKRIYKAGCLPFAQLYRDELDQADYGSEYEQFARLWSRPAATKSFMKGLIP